MAIFEKIIRRLYASLDVRSGVGVGASDPAWRAVFAALLGESETAVTVVDTAYDSTRWIVLGSVDPDRPLPDYPLIIKGQLSTDLVLPRLIELGWLGRETQLTTQEVADWFGGRCAGLAHEEMPSSWAPAAVESVARITLAGDLGERQATSSDVDWPSNYYEWFDLEEVPLAGSVWRLSSTSTLWVFTRREAGRWEVSIVPQVRWAKTRAERQDFGTLLTGALETYRLCQDS